jgi:integrase
MANKVHIENLRGNLRLRWMYKGERYCISLGLPDTAVPRCIAQSKASLIEADMLNQVFDSTLKKYRGEDPHNPAESGLTVSALFDQLFQLRAKRFTGTTHERYRAIAKRLGAFFGVALASSVDEAQADRFRESLGTLQPITQLQYLGLVNACWVWGNKQGLLSSNPWVEVIKIQVPPQQRPRPFTAIEIKSILDGFKTSRYYRYYWPFVRFLLGTGCRTGEAVGLQWGHLAKDCSKVWIGQSVSRGKRKSTKTNKDREFKLPGYLVTELQARRPENCKPTDLVFPALRGGAIDASCFRSRAWVSVLRTAGVEYRKPYNTRHTFISHALAQGANPVAIAQMTGHDLETLFKHYAADIQGGLQCPDIFA